MISTFKFTLRSWCNNQKTPTLAWGFFNKGRKLWIYKLFLLFLKERTIKSLIISLKFAKIRVYTCYANIWRLK